MPSESQVANEYDETVFLSGFFEGENVAYMKWYCEENFDSAVHA